MFSFQLNPIMQRSFINPTPQNSRDRASSSLILLAASPKSLYLSSVFAPEFFIFLPYQPTCHYEGLTVVSETIQSKPTHLSGKKIKKKSSVKIRIGKGEEKKNRILPLTCGLYLLIGYPNPCVPSFFAGIAKASKSIRKSYCLMLPVGRSESIKVPGSGTASHVNKLLDWIVVTCITVFAMISFSLNRSQLLQ